MSAQDAETVPLGWVEVAVLLKGKYEVRERGDGWHVYVYDEQTAAHLDGKSEGG